jgi:uncharacterized cofD-like protein
MWNSRIKVLLRPGLGLKRWLLLFALGMALFGLGVGFAMSVSISPKILPALRTITLVGLDPMVRGAIFIVAGVALGAMSARQIYIWVISGVSQRRGDVDILTAVDLMQHRVRGPRIVAIGGGTGVSTLLRGLKQISSNLTAIVTIADDGGSSGRLREDMHMPPPGDARNCLIALSEAGSLMEEVFDYRFDVESHLNGHNLGNLLLAALYDRRGGFQEGLEAAARLLAVSGSVVPVSNNIGLVLMGETISGQIMRGESSVGLAPEPLKYVWIEPKGAVANEAALEAIRKAELIIIGPGSLYTSIIPNFLIPAISEAVTASHAPKVFVCNVATQPHETDSYGVAEHLEVFRAHSGVNVTHIVVNEKVRDLPLEINQAAVESVSKVNGFAGHVILADVVDDSFPTRHDSYKLANIIAAIDRNAFTSSPVGS